MAIITFPAQERYSKNRGEGTEPRKKLKKLRSVKVANLDRLRLSMRREKYRFNHGLNTPSDDGTDPSEVSSTPMSGSSSPNYMKATTSSSARKGSLQTSSGNVQSSSVSSSSSITPARKKKAVSAEKPSSKFNRVTVQQCSDPTGVNIPVDIKSGRSLNRVSSVKRSRRLSSLRSMRLRAKYSQFPDESGSSSLHIAEFDDSGVIITDGMEPEEKSKDLNDNASHDEDSMVRPGRKQKGILERSRSIKLTRLRSIRSSRRRQKSRLGGGVTTQTSYEADMSNATAHYMKGTSSQEARKNSAKGLTRTSSLRPLRILAKIPSLRPRSNVRKRPEVTSQPGISVNRATCSSTLKSSKFSDQVELLSVGRDVCPYSYCSLHGKHHHAAFPPLKEFISAKRQMLNNQKGKQLENQCREEVQPVTSVTKANESTQIVTTESPITEEVTDASIINAPEVEDTGIDFLVKIYAKPRKKWDIEGTHSGDAEALNGSVSNEINVRDYDWKLVETLSYTSEATQEALDDGQLESYQKFSLSNIEPDDITQQHTSKIAVSNSTLELPEISPTSASTDKALEAFIKEKETQSSLKDPLHFPSRDSEVSPRGDLSNILSDKQKYTSIWQLIYQQFVSSEASMSGNQGVNVDERVEGGDANTFPEMNFDLRQSNYYKNHNEDVDHQTVAMEKIEFDQNSAIKLVEEALNAILQREQQSSSQQSTPDKEMPHTPEEHVFSPKAASEENFAGCKIDGEETSLESEDKLHSLEQPDASLQQKAESNEEKLLENKTSKSYSRLRKLMVTAKFIKAMDTLRRINPRKPRYLSSEPISEEEKVYLRHLSMKGNKNDEEWMLDYALRQVISRLAPDQQRKVALLVEAFETVTPGQKGKGIRCNPMKGESAFRIGLHTSMNKEPKLSVESDQEKSISHELVSQKQNDWILLSHKSVPEEESLREDHDCEPGAAGNDAPDDKLPQKSDETDDSHSIKKPSRDNSRSASMVNAAVEEPCMGIAETMKPPEVPPPISTEHEVSLAGDMTSILFDKQKYTSMWNLIYQHVTSSEASVDGDKGDNGSDEKGHGRQEVKELVSRQSSYNENHKEEEEDNRSAASENHEFNQSAAIKLIKEAVIAILQRHEQSSDQHSIPDHDKATNDAEERCFPAATYSSGENQKGGKRLEMHTRSEPKAKLHQVEKTSEEFQQQMEHNESNMPQKKMSKSYSKLKKAIVTAKFIKAIERLRKTSLQKSQHLHPEAASGEERVYLRHLSMDGRKNHEEWMLDYALRQVISKLDPDQQRRVASLVEAFETVTPEQKQKSVRCYPLTGEPVPDIRLSNPTNKAPKQFVRSEQERSISDEQVPQNPDNGFLPSSIGTLEQRTLHEAHDHQESAADEKTQQETETAAVPDSMSKLPEDSSKSASVDVVHKDPTNEDEETISTVKVPSQLPNGDYEVSIAGDMTTILSDKQKYTSMWHLIYQHVIPSEASIVGKQGGNRVEEDELGDSANKSHKKSELASTQSSQSTNQKEVDNNLSAACEKREIDQLAAIKLVKDAINKILQCDEHISDKQSLQHTHMGTDKGGELGNTTAIVSTEGNSGGKRGEHHRSSETEDKLHTSKSYGKLRKMIVAANFIKAMERLKRRIPRKPQYLSPEAASEEERVHLRPQNTKEKRNDEEWMLDYALRKVISNLDPDQQRKVALLVEAFEAVTPEQKDKGIRSQTRAELAPVIVESNHDDSTSYEDHVHANHKDLFSSLGKVAPLEKSQQGNYPIEISKIRTEQQDGVLDSDGNYLHTYYQVSLKVTEEETESNPMCESLQQACLSKEPKQESEAKTAKSMFSDTQKHTTMWHLIYQHVKSVTPAETGSNLGERVANEDIITSGNTLPETSLETDNDNDASSVTSELTENDAIKLVKEAIDGILDVPHELGNDLLSNNITVASEEDKRAAVAEKHEKSRSRGYSKLRKLIICNKFIRAIEKMRKPYPQKRKNLMLDADPEAEKAHLKPSAVGEKNSDNWMLDYALQKVIAGLAPVQQRRVTMLVEAFEKVNPDVEETGKAFCCIKNESADGLSSAGNAKEKEPTFDSSQNSSGLPGSSVKLDESVATSSREIFTGSTQEEVNEVTNSSEEYESKGQDWRNGDPFSTTVATSDATGMLPDLHKKTKEVKGAKMPCSSFPLEDTSSTAERLAKYNGPDTESKAEPSQHKDSKDDCNSSTENDTSFDSENYTSLWRLLARHLKSAAPEKMEKQIPCEIDANAEVESGKMLLQKKNDDPHQLSPKVNHDEDVDVETPKSTSFEFQQKEAIKLVQEALDEILLLPDQKCDDQTMNTNETPYQEVCNEKHRDGRKPSPSTAELAGAETLQDTAATPQEEKTSPKEKAPSSYSTLSKVILCKRFIKAMDKMRKLKPQSPSYHSQQLQSEAESFHSMRKVTTNGKKSWEEWMLDHAMQQVVQKLAPAQKKKVALLVQAFETVSSEPEPRSSRKVKAAAL